MTKDGDNVQAASSSLDLLNTVSVKVPAFWPDFVEAWFMQVEAPFALKGVTTSSTKFYYCVSSFNHSIIKGMKQSLIFLSPVIWNLQSLCQICSLCYLLVTNRVSFSVERFWRGYPPTFELTCWGTIFPIILPLPWKRTKSIRAKFPPLLFTRFPAPRRMLSIPWDPHLQTTHNVQRLHTPAAGITDHSLRPCVTIIVPGVLRLRNVELHVPGGETSLPARGCSYSSCQAFYLVSSNLSTGFSEFKEVPHRFRRLCISFSWSRILRRRFRSEIINCGWFFSLKSFLYDSGSTGLSGLFN